MPDYETHMDKYQHNKNFVRFGINNHPCACKDEIFDDWEITGYFYAAVHLIEAVLAKKCGLIEVHTHKDRQTKMEDNPKIFNKDFRTEYGELKSLCWTARYKGTITIDPDDAKVAQECLEDLELSMKPYTS